MPLAQEFTRLVAVRHGETVWNREGRYMNQLDSPLTDLGERQAVALAKRLASTSFDAIYTSDLGRAIRTARIITDETGGEAIPCAALREHAMGCFQGLTLSEVEEKYPEERHRLSHDPDFTIEGGESIRTFHSRVTQGFEDILGRHRGQTILAICHGGVLETLIRYVMQVPLDAHRPARVPNCGLNVFHVFDTHWMLNTWGDVSHLEGEL